MVPWRDKGVVEDSDEEDQEFALDQRTRSDGDILEANNSHTSSHGSHQLAPLEPALPSELSEIAYTAISLSGEEGVHGRSDTSPSPFRQCSTLESDKTRFREPITGILERGGEPLPQTWETSIDDIDELQDDRIYYMPSAAHVGPNDGHVQMGSQQDVSSKLREGEAPDVFDIPSSPPDESADSPLHPTRQYSTVPTLQPPLSPSRRASTGVPANHEVVQHAPKEDLYSPESDARRTFRPRNPIQMHPYLLENEQYRKSFHARGLRPVHVAPTAGLDGDTQNRDTQQEDGLRGHDQPSSQLSRWSSTSPDSPGDQLHAMHNSDGYSSAEDIPDLDTLTRAPVVGEQRSGFKRRKTTQGLATVQVDEHEPFHEPDRPASSPAHSTLPKPKRSYRKKFRFPPGFSPAQLPTPVASSELSRSTHDVMHAESDSESEPASERRGNLPSRPSLHDTPKIGVTPISIPSSGPDDSEPESSGDEQIRRAQKRIRGVLPASWLRLDKQPQRPKHLENGHRPWSKSSPNGVPDKGIARKIPHRHTHDTSTGLNNDVDRPNVFDMSEEFGGSDIEHLRPLSPLRNSSVTNGIATLPTFDEDVASVIEEDYVDPMLQKSERVVFAPRKKRKKQMRLMDSFQRSTTRPDVKQIRSGTSNKHNGATLGAKPRRAVKAHRKSAPRLSILDAPQAASAPPLPSFIGVARRQVRSRRDQGRHSPGKKQISLHTQQDGTEVDDVLRDWRNGRLKSVNTTRRPPTSGHRVPLSEQSHNRQAQLPRYCSKDLADDNGPSRIFAAPQQRRSKPKTKTRQSLLAGISGNQLQATDDPFAEQTRTQDALSSLRHPKAIDGGLRARERQGQLEELETEHDAHHSTSAFRRDLLQLSTKPRPSLTQQQRPATIPLQRFLAEAEDVDDVLLTTDAPIITRDRVHPENNKPLSSSRSRPRKRQPRWLDLGQIEIHRRLVDDLPLEQTPSPPPRQIAKDSSPAVQGLGPFGTQYTKDFGIAPFSMGICFRQTSFIGGGELRAVLNLKSKDLDVDTGSTIVSYKDLTATLGPWTEEVSSHLKALCARVIRDHESLSLGSQLVDDLEPRRALTDVSTVLRTMMRYLTLKLSFFDTIDRQLCVSTLTGMARDLYSFLRDMRQRPADARLSSSCHSLVQPLSYLLAFCAAGLAISQDVVVNQETSHHLKDVTGSVGKELMKTVLGSSSHQLQAFHDPANLRYVREAGIGDEEISIEAILISYHILEGIGFGSLNFWTLVNDELCQRLPEQCVDVRLLENIWLDMFAILPLLELDVIGILRPGFRIITGRSGSGPCVTAQQLLKSTFALGLEQCIPPTLNAYVRAVLGRCYTLLRTWRWRKSEALLGSMFDFFAGNGLHMLRNEEKTAGCSFLERLDLDMTPHADASDGSFQIFLKTLAIGLLQLQEIYTDKKIKNITWRFVPNHGRSHKKEDALKQEDLSALRNHHDLLSVLYYASPVSARPKLALLRGLVDFKASHVELCRLNTRAWANLVRYQLSTDESAECIDTFVAWFDEMTSGCLFQHRLARTEAEAVRDSTNTIGTIFISQTMLESTISGNQRNVESILEALLGSLTGIVRHANNVTAATALVEKISMSPILDLFEGDQKRPHKIIKQALETIEVYFEVRSKQVEKRDTTANSGESQDYGDWPSEDEGRSPQTGKQTLNAAERVANEVQAMLSNVCGADGIPDDNLLARLVDVHVSAAAYLVKAGVRQWTYYIGDHGSGSWHRFRDTDQTHKFEPYFYAAILEHDCHILHEGTTDLMCAWLVSLVERESMLQYQHRLTAAMLNAGPGHSLLRNLPFARGSPEGRFVITLDDLRSRRLSLVSSLLSNIRSTYEDSFMSASTASIDLREIYVAPLRALSSAMKRNYQEMQTGIAPRGAYVDFVQTVVQFLQQHTADILPVDKFFTDSLAFPLPTTDPLYITGRLRSYQLRASDLTTQKKLVVFVQTATERAATEKQQDYLTTQLCESVYGTFDEPGADATCPSLRRLLLEAVFPAYVEASLSYCCGGLVARPILIALAHVLGDSLCTFDLANHSSLISATSSVNAVLSTATAAILSLSGDRPHGYFTQALSHSETLETLSLLFKVAAAACPLLNFAARSTVDVKIAARSIHVLNRLSDRVREAIAQRPSPRLQQMDDIGPGTEQRRPTAFPQTHAFAVRELRHALQNNWKQQSDQTYQVLRMGVWRDVIVETQDERRDFAQRLMISIQDYKQTLQRMDALTNTVDRVCGVDEMEQVAAVAYEQTAVAAETGTDAFLGFDAFV